MPENKTMKPEKRRIQCPFCGYRMPVYYFDREEIPERTGFYMRCKRQNCRKEFELKKY